MPQKHAGLFFSFLLIAAGTFCQPLTAQLTAAIAKLEADAAFAGSILSFYVEETATGKVVYEKNARVGMAPASCQKVVTSVSAFEMLGQQYRYPTKVYLKGIVRNNVLQGGLYAEGVGDPTLGSWRYPAAREDAFFVQLQNELKSRQIKLVTDGIAAFRKNFESQTIPDGWIWEDIANYYGAGAACINWRENQFDIQLRSGNKTGELVSIAGYKPASLNFPLKNECRVAAKGSGDNAYIYFGLNGAPGFLRGTIPAGEQNFVISGAVPDPVRFFQEQGNAFLRRNGLADTTRKLPGQDNPPFSPDSQYLPLMTYLSPPLDSINYWFLKKSINLYGEALVKTIAFQKLGLGSTDEGINLIRNFWAERGIAKAALKIIDGSGLSPQNRVTAQALVSVLRFARQRPWFASFYEALPEMNGLKMKDGYISGVRSYAGYAKSKTGLQYTYCFMVNNFDGSPGTVREKMWKVLDLLK